MARFTENPRALAGLAAVFIISILAATVLDAIVVVPVAVLAAFGAAYLLIPGTASGPMGKSERQSFDLHMERQLRNGRKLAILDPQTAMLQRWYFELRVAEEARRCRRYGTSMAVMFIKVQDQGASGAWTQEDEMDFVQVFGRTLRSVDLAAHIGERLYAVCLPNTTDAGADTAAQRMLKNAGAYSVTALVAICPRDGLDYDALIDHAVAFTPGEYASRRAASTSNSLQLVQLLGSEEAGHVPLAEGESARNTKAKLRRASKRAGVDVRLWEEDGAIHFERLDPLRQEGAA